MKLWANLHFHTSDDPEDPVRYSFYEGIDEAVRVGLQVVALTCHKFFAWKKEYAEYAESKGVLLIPGIELSIKIESRDIKGRHVVVLNCDKSVEKVRSLDDLRMYKKEHPEAFILAAHPYFHVLNKQICLNKHLEKNIDIFDGVEHSWFYSKFINYNKKAQLTARKHGLPLIATSDTHFFGYMGTDYAVIDTEEKSITGVLEALKRGSYYNVTLPKKFWKDMIKNFLFGWEIGNNILGKKFREIK